MMKEIRFLIPSIFIILFSITSLYSTTSRAFAENDLPEVHINPEPDWINQTLTQADYQPNVAKTNDDFSVRYILIEQQTNAIDKDIVNYHRIIMQPINEKGLEKVSEITFDFNPLFEELSVHKIEVKRDNKSYSKLIPDQIKVFKNESELKNRLYLNDARALIILNDIRVGDIIEYSFSRKGRNPVLGEKLFGQFYADWGVPVEAIRLRLLTDKKTQLQFRTQYPATKKVEQNTREYSWSFNNVNPVKNEDLYPSWFSPYSIIEYSEYQSWREVNQWALTLYPPQSVPAKLQQKISQWKKEYPTTEAQIAVALKFVQDEIRYFGIEVGENTHKPHTPEEVFERRYGDCKDKTTLLIAILAELGVTAHPALVSSYQGKILDQQLPSPLPFNHVIAHLKFNKRDYWLDSTVSHQRGGLNNIGFINYHHALIVAEGQKSLAKVNANDSPIPQVYLEETYHLSEDKEAVFLNVKTAYEGIKADNIRYQIATESIQSLSERYLNFYSRQFDKISLLENIQVIDDEKSNLLTTIEKYKILDFGRKQSGKLYSDYYATGIVEHLVTPTIIQREHPFAVSHGFQFRQKQIIELPDNDIVDYSKENITKDIDYFSFSKQIDKQENRITITYDYRPLIPTISAKETGDYLSSVKDLKEALSFYLVTKNNASSTVQSQQERLKNLARKLINKE
ncbi:DUF3857 domain-containing transglutaminase family protein [Aliikangiella maris]|uniref:DUF3857 domain-containing protein n=2 Tax=Aliikangiella maris TaxID=3162458 RepID=A0ABV3MNK4_9GAMM